MRNKHSGLFTILLNTRRAGKKRPRPPTDHMVMTRTNHKIIINRHKGKNSREVERDFHRAEGWVILLLVRISTPRTLTPQGLCPSTGVVERRSISTRSVKPWLLSLLLKLLSLLLKLFSLLLLPFPLQPSFLLSFPSFRT